MSATISISNKSSVYCVVWCHTKEGPLKFQYLAKVCTTCMYYVYYSPLLLRICYSECVLLFLEADDIWNEVPTLQGWEKVLRVSCLSKGWGALDKLLLAHCFKTAFQHQCPAWTFWPQIGKAVNCRISIVGVGSYGFYIFISFPFLLGVYFE